MDLEYEIDEAFSTRFEIAARAAGMIGNAADVDDNGWNACLRAAVSIIDMIIEELSVDDFCFLKKENGYYEED